MKLTKHQIVERLIDLSGAEEFEDRIAVPGLRIEAKNQADGTIELLVYGIVGDEYHGLTDRGVAELLAASPNAPVLVRVNTPGGLAFQGITIHNILVKHAGPVTVEIQGIAASAGSIIAAAGDQVGIVANASIFIHRALGIAAGNEGDFQDYAEFLRGLDKQIARTLAAKSGQSVERMLELMAGKVDGTSFDAEAAVELGLADEVLPIRPEKDGGARDQGSGAAGRGSPDPAPALGAGLPTPPDSAENTVPADPAGGKGEAVSGGWKKPKLEDFTEDAWDDLSDSRKRSIGRHYAWYPNLATFDGLSLPHHFPPNHSKKGQASLNGVRAALARLEKTKGPTGADKKKIRAHLEAHLPEDQRAEILAAIARDAATAEAANEYLAERQRLWELTLGTG